MAPADQALSHPQRVHPERRGAADRRALQATLSPDEATRIRREPTADVEAYQLYFRGRHLVIGDTDEGRRLGLEYYRRASERDPGFALAHAATAMVLADQIRNGNAVNPGAAYVQARAAAERAIEVDPELSDARLARAILQMIWEYNWDGAAAGFQRAIELNPGNADAPNWLGNWYDVMERHDDALAMQERARLLDPMAHRTDIATTLLRSGRNREAQEVLMKALEFHPNAPRLHATLGWALLRQGQASEGLAALRRACELEGDEPLYLAQYGQALAMSGARDAALEVLARLEQQARERYVSPKHFAYVYTGLGDAARAMDYLEQAYEQHSGAYTLPGSFLFESLRQHPRFRRLRARMNL
jgi:serine/threonine-protein kinase